MEITERLKNVLGEAAETLSKQQIQLLVAPYAQTTGIEAGAKLSKDLKEAAKILTKQEVRYLVDIYYLIQENRKAAANQVRAMEAEPTALVDFFSGEYTKLESNIKKAMEIYSDNDPIGKWCRSIVGIGPVIASGLLAHIDISKCQTAGHIWRFAGLDSTVHWFKREEAESIAAEIVGDGSSDSKKKKGATQEVTAEQVYAAAARKNVTPSCFMDLVKMFQKKDQEKADEKHSDDGKEGKAEKVKMQAKHLEAALKMRPFNASLKTLTWKASESFVKVCNNEDDIYGHIYVQRKIYEQAKNDAGDYADQAKHILATRKIGKTTEAYKWYSQGKLPPGHIHARAKRYAAKQFLSDLHAVWYKHHFKKDPPKPYPISHLGHVHQRPVPNMPE
jgi:hypothetical protein